MNSILTYTPLNEPFVFKLFNKKYGVSQYYDIDSLFDNTDPELLVRIYLGNVGSYELSGISFYSTVVITIIITFLSIHLIQKRKKISITMGRT